MYLEAGSLTDTGPVSCCSHLGVLSIKHAYCVNFHLFFRITFDYFLTHHQGSLRVAELQWSERRV